MKKDKITYLELKKIQKKADENMELFENQYAQNPIKAKFLAFQKTKDETKNSVENLFD